MIYEFKVSIPHGSDEFWEKMEELPLEERLAHIKEVLEYELFAYYATVTNLTTYQAELDLS